MRLKLLERRQRRSIIERQIIKFKKMRREVRARIQTPMRRLRSRMKSPRRRRKPQSGSGIIILRARAKL